MRTALARTDHVLQVDASDEVLARAIDFVDAAVRTGVPPQVKYCLQLGGMSLSIRPAMDGSELWGGGRNRWRPGGHPLPWEKS